MHGSRRTRREIAPLLACGLTLALCGPLLGQAIELRLSATTAFVGEPLTVDVVVSNMDEQAVPTPPTTPDFQITPYPGNPVGRSQRISIINGRQSASVDYTYRYTVVPQKQGTLLLPPFSVAWRGLTYHTGQAMLQVTRDNSGSDLICEIQSDRETAYVGQTISLTLYIWVRQYQQPGLGTLPAGTMWSLLDGQASSLGVFGQADWERPEYREATRFNADGEALPYFVYSVRVQVCPLTVGDYDFGEIAVVWNYPKRITRGIFNLELRDSRRIRAVPTSPRLVIKPVPTEGRPPDFNGAIGPYTIAASARPTVVPVGDPITLTLEISGEGPLEQLGPPRLSQVEALTRDFEVAGDSLAGEVRGRRKVFAQTIRARREDVTQIPPIPFSFFDPDTAMFRTVYSAPIPLTVKPVERLLTPDGLGRPITLAPIPLTETTEGLLANEADPARLLADHRPGLGPGAIALLAALPAAYVLAWVAHRRSARYREDLVWRRRLEAARNARRALRTAPAGRSSAIRAALARYIADRAGAAAVALTREEAVQVLLRHEIPPDLVTAVDQLLGSLELAEYGGQSSALPQNATATALDLIDRLERCRWTGPDPAWTR